MKAKNGSRRLFRYRWLIFVVLAIGYVLVYFHRVSSAVVASELAEAFHLSGAILGVLASAYFYPYAIMQLPAGLLSDSLGPRKAVTLSTLIAALGAVLFGISPTVSLAITARIFIGLGVAVIFIPAMKIFAEWFLPREFAMMTAILMIIGGLGWLSASTPLALLTLWLGWRLAFIMIGLGTLLLAILSWSIIRDRPQDMGLPSLAEMDVSKSSAIPGKSRIGLLEGMRIVLCQRHFWPLAIWFFFNSGTIFGFGGLWGGPFMMEVYGLNKAETANILMMIPVGIITGSPLLSFISDRVIQGRKPVLIGSAIVLILTWIPLAFFAARLGTVILALICFLMGVFSGGIVVIAFTTTKELFPTAITGTSTGTVNLFPFFGGAVFQPLMGAILDKVGKAGGAYPACAYEWAFLASFIATIFAFIAILFMKETFPRSDGPDKGSPPWA
ncbi:MAG: MFS transporter [Proteobacteria bacterium]|nr:MFS transporter [Pseudomonadota bacterium]